MDVIYKTGLKSKKIKKRNCFKGVTEDEILAKTLPDLLVPNLDIVIIGINPGLYSAYKGHHYAGPSNHFWKCLNLSGLTPKEMSHKDDFRLLEFGIGFTNVVERTSKSSVDLSKQEIVEGCKILLKKLQTLKPKIAVFNGKLIYEIFSGKKQFNYGVQHEFIQGTNSYIWVMPSSSARSACYPSPSDKLPFYLGLKKLRDHLNGTVSEFNSKDFIFPLKSNNFAVTGAKKDVASEYFLSSTNNSVIECDVTELNTIKAKFSFDTIDQEGMEKNLNILRLICHRNTKN
ncbi:G/T mismatch-specific thymine DNA glycosylase [Halyomorpha halys]|uniref:G/T mismatch-specific thymine DNA glycosylase n=1 Tax=Halyomorpha halys TaxID=286706 RepID=UPI0006D5279E|nr:G/T mismatch-specific thymine DNA glycosylase [Halyomorpha halys]